MFHRHFSSQRRGRPAWNVPDSAVRLTHLPTGLCGESGRAQPNLNKESISELRKRVGRAKLSPSQAHGDAHPSIGA